jgi:acyl-CoA synthetase (AMP-forming)/AMP-acid ligase II
MWSSTTEDCVPQWSSAEHPMTSDHVMSHESAVSADLPVPRPQGEKTITDVLERVARDQPAAEAYLDGDVRITYSDLAARSSGLAARLQTLGVGRGDVVAVQLPSSIEYAVTYLAAARLGAVTTGLNPRLGRRELEGIFAQARPVAMVIDDEAEIAHLGAAELPLLRRSDVAGTAAGDPEWRPTDLDSTDPVAIVWTSGTTGAPKGAVFDHANLEALSRATGELSMPFDRRLSPVPFSHVGYMTRVWDEIGNAMCSVIVPTPWKAAIAVDLIEAEHITVGQGVPTQWELILRQPDLGSRDTSSLRLISTGAARVPAALVARLRETFRCPVVVRYATTEASVISGTLRADPPEVVEATVGAACPTVEVRVADDEGRPVAVGTEGMIEVRSGAVMRRYVGGEHGSPRRPDGWLVTGDAGSMDEHDRIRLIGRRSEMYIRGGYNVYPLEVEQVLGEHAGVEEVAVAGIPDDVLGARGVAWVVPADPSHPPTLEDLRSSCREQLADYKAPDELVLVGELPRNHMGKVEKRMLTTSAKSPMSGGRGATNGNDPKQRRMS